MALPSGSGSEILRRGTLNTLSNGNSSVKFDGTATTVGTTTHAVPALHIVTLLSFTACNSGAGAEKLYVWVHDGANDIHLLYDQDLAGYQTFVWNDRFVLQAGDKLHFQLGATGTVDIYYSFIDQDWT